MTATDSQGLTSSASQQVIVNHPPVTTAQEVTSAEDAPLPVTLSGNDLDNDPLTFQVVEPPPHGSLSGVAPTLVYLPNRDYNGPDSFSFTVNDGMVDSLPATISIMVTPVNDPPVADAGPDQTVHQSDTVTLNGSATDIDEDALTYHWVLTSRPANSAAVLADAGQAATSFIADQAGTYTVELTVHDGTVGSQVASVTITVLPRSVAVPSLVGLTRIQAEAALLAAGLAVGNVTSEYSATIPAGKIISQNPAAGTDVAEGTRIAFVVSLGAAGGSVSISADHSVVEIGTAITLSWVSTYSGTCSIEPGVGPVPCSDSTTLLPAATTTYTLTAVNQTGIHSAEVTVQVNGQPAAMPMGSFGAQYEDIIPPDATIASYVPKRFSIVTGLVHDSAGQQLAGVMVTVLGHPDYGTVSTDNNGRFAIPVEGGGTVTLHYQRQGLLVVQRNVDVGWNDFAVAETIRMIAEDQAATTITFDNNPATIITHKSSEVFDEFGQSSTTIVFAGNNSAHLVDELGNPTSQLPTITVRATEYTTMDSMPAVLPPNSAYTYCVELSVDGAKRVQFTRPVIMWVDNFLGFDIGEAVPVGYYDRDRGEWVPSNNGRVVKLLDRDGDGVVDALDADGDGQPDDLNHNGSLNDEVTGLDDPTLYSPGSTFWRVAVTHFTPYDCNWPYVPPAGATSPTPAGPVTADQQPAEEAAKKPDEKNCTGSFVENRSRIFHEDIPVPGTDLTLHYASSRVNGYKSVLTIPVSGDAVPTSLKHILVQVDIAGKRYERTVDMLPHQAVQVEWDGRDIFDREVVGTATAHVEIGYVYDAVYATAGDFSRSFAQVGENVSPVRARQEIISWQSSQLDLAARGDTIAEGWTISAHHYLNQLSPATLLKGDGLSLTKQPEIIETVTGHGIDNNGNPITADFVWLDDIAVDVAGNIYVTDSSRRQIYKIDVNGVISVAAGSGQDYYSGDGGPAVEAGLDYPMGVAVDSKGNIYIADGGDNRIRKVDTDGIITTVAGNGNRGFQGDGGAADQASFYWPTDVAVDSFGNLYICDQGNNRIRKVGADGIITTVAGTGDWGFNGDNIPATAAYLSYPTGLEIDGNGGLYIADTWNSRIRKVDKTGIITTIAGTGIEGIPLDWRKATESPIGYPYRLAVDQSGSVYFSDQDFHAIWKILPTGILIPVMGRALNRGFIGDGGPPSEALLTYPSGVAVDAAGRLYVTSFKQNWYAGVRKTTGPNGDKGMPPGTTFFAEENKTVHIIKHNGQHERTIDAETGLTLRWFDYDQDNLVAIRDRFGGTVSIERDASGRPKAIVSSDGLRTSLTINAQNHLTRVTFPDDNFFSFDYYNDGLLYRKTDPAQHIFTYAYDASGRLSLIVDPIGGNWTYNRTVSDRDATINYTSAEGNSTVFQEQTSFSGGYSSAVKDFFSETLYSKGADRLSVAKSLPCGMDITYRYGADPLYQFQFIAEEVENTPLGLARRSTTNRAYQDNNADGQPDLFTDTVTINGRATTLVNDVLAAQRSATSPAGRAVVSHYDPATLLTTSTSIAGLFDTEYQYDARGRLTATSTNTRATRYGYNSHGFLDHIIDPENRTFSYTYDTVGRVTEVQRPDGSGLGFAYDANGNMTVLARPSGVTHGFGYNGVNLTESYQAPLSGSYSYVYDRDRRLARTIFPTGRQIENIYDKNRLARIRTPEGDIDFTYLCSSKVDTVTNGLTAINYDYDGPLVTAETITGIVNQSIGYTYDNDFAITGLTYAGSTFSQTHDSDGLLTGAGDFVISRDPGNGLPISVSNSRLHLGRTFNGYGEVAGEESKINGRTVVTWSTSRDNAGRIISRTETVNGIPCVYTYSYDAMGRLHRVTLNGTMVEEYTYDTNGVRINDTNVLRGIVGRPMEYSEGDHLLRAGNSLYEYDLDGFLASKINGTATTNYIYSTRGELLSVELPGNGRIEYLYDPLGRRIAKKINGAMVEKYLWSGATTLLTVYDGADNLLMRFEYADGRLPYAMTSGNSRYYLAYDQVGSLRIVADSSGNVIKQVDYDSFGNVVYDSDPSLELPIGFAGGLPDRDTGLVRFGARDYDPDTGRWTAKDPILFAGGDTDLYGYVQNNPVNFVDPSGLWVDKLPYLVDFAEGFLSPTSPPPTPGGLAGFLARDQFDKHVDIDKVIDSISEGASKLWEDYYKTENPGWKYDPYSPYYEPPPKRGPYWEQRPANCP